LKQYQVTRKRQITLPKKLAEKRGIKPGDSIVFEESGDYIVLKKVARRPKRTKDVERIRKAIQLYSSDIPKIKKGVKLAESTLIENFSRRVSSK